MARDVSTRGGRARHWRARARPATVRRASTRAPPSMSTSSVAADRVGWLRAEPGEWAAFGWSFLYFFALLAGYYVLRPVRDALGAVHRLEWLFTATFVCMVLLTPVYGALVARFRR